MYPDIHLHYIKLILMCYMDMTCNYAAPISIDTNSNSLCIQIPPGLTKAHATDTVVLYGIKTQSRIWMCAQYCVYFIITSNPPLTRCFKFDFAFTLDPDMYPGKLLILNCSFTLINTKYFTTYEEYLVLQWPNWGLVYLFKMLMSNFKLTGLFICIY